MKKHVVEFKFIELETSRLRLRKLVLSDAAQLELLRSDERVNRYLDRPASTSYAEAVQFVNKILAADSYYWVINLKNETKLIGTVCFWNLDYENSVVEIGYELLPEFHGKGIMMEALPAVIAYNLDHLQFDTIIATTHSENIPSIKLLENNDFKRDSLREKQLHVEGGHLNEVVYSLKKHKAS
ncbi:MAG TPA: GNAT family N-acetyltransferase [Mucilaginibacter sp.]|jgi:ribosomal-protein-alanine N-acetyltransferase